LKYAHIQCQDAATIRYLHKTKAPLLHQLNTYKVSQKSKPLHICLYMFTTINNNKYEKNLYFRYNCHSNNHTTTRAYPSLENKQYLSVMILLKKFRQKLAIITSEVKTTFLQQCIKFNVKMLCSRFYKPTR